MEPIERQMDSATFERAQQLGLAPLVAKILARRNVHSDLAAFMSPKLANLSSPFTLPDIDIAVERILRALANKEVIALETDHDCDGQTSHAVLFEALVKHFGHPRDKVLTFIGHRLEEGYGLSEALSERILAHSSKPTLVITADNGSTDEPRISKLQEHGIDVIVTDHHAIPVDGIPKSALAVVNPTRTDSKFDDPFIAGCMVAWLLMAAVANRLSQQQEVPSVKNLLDFVAVGTVADCVSMSRSLNNRIVVSYGLKIINQFLRPCWRAVKPMIYGPVFAETVGFNIGPLLNSDGRLDSALGSVSFLLAETDLDAKAWVQVLSESNSERKALQRSITAQATKVAQLRVAQGYNSLVIFLEDSHPGVHGISASRIKDEFGRPTILMAPKYGSDDVITGSARSIDGWDIRANMQAIADSKPKWLVGFGGHKGAAGITILRSGLDEFTAAFERQAKQIDSSEIGARLYHDGALEAYTPDVWREALEVLEPFGREFDSPSFLLTANVQNIKPFGAGHSRLTLKGSYHQYPCVWFFNTEAGFGKYVLRPQISYFRSAGHLEHQILFHG